METLQTFISFTFLLFQVINARYYPCRTQFCGLYQQLVRFPFLIQDEYQQPQNSCGYPGFNLSCPAQLKLELILTLPNSGNFTVRNINYVTQEIELYDPNGCLPRRLIDLNLSSSPFTVSYSQNYTFLSCPPAFTTRSRLPTVDCLGNETASIVATSSMNLVGALDSCSVMFTLPIPVSWPPHDEWLASEVNRDLRLTWKVPDCVDCETRGGICGFENKFSNKTFCFNDPGKGKSRRIQISRIIALSIVVPAITFSICISCFICIAEGRRNRGAPQNSATVEAVHETPPHIAISGLDDLTIESYTKVVLGESRRLPGPNGATCPICLVDYDPKDTVRCIPLCEHCFHSECIDEWLRMNGTCPVCRNSPSPARANT